jgi:hypothetical protein
MRIFDDLNIDFLGKRKTAYRNINRTTFGRYNVSILFRGLGTWVSTLKADQK